MYVAGIDLSSRAIHIVLLDFDTNHATDYDFHAKGDTPFERARDMRRVFPRHSWWEDHGVALVGLEEPYSRANHAAKALGIMAGALAVLLPPELPVVPTSPVEWKRILTGNPNASKEVVRFHALAHWLNPPSGPDVAQDTFDAFGVAWCVRTLNEQAIAKGEAA